MLNRNI